MQFPLQLQFQPKSPLADEHLRVRSSSDHCDLKQISTGTLVSESLQFFTPIHIFHLHFVVEHTHFQSAIDHLSCIRVLAFSSMSTCRKLTLNATHGARVGLCRPRRLNRRSLVVFAEPPPKQVKYTQAWNLNKSCLEDRCGEGGEGCSGGV